MISLKATKHIFSGRIAYSRHSPLLLENLPISFMSEIRRSLRSHPFVSAEYGKQSGCVEGKFLLRFLGKTAVQLSRVMRSLFLTPSYVN